MHAAPASPPALASGTNAPLVWAVAAALLLSACDRPAQGTATEGRIDYAARPPVRLTMEELHRGGGVPPGWTLSVARGEVEVGRRIFRAQGCPSCHAIQGEPTVDGERRPGPDLTGMGSHHPGAYFAEAIVNPNAVIVDGPGYAGADGLSTMPAYPHLTVGELTHVVTYLESLTSGGGEHAGCDEAAPRLDFRGDRLPPAEPAPAPPVAAATAEEPRAFLALTYAIRAGRVEAVRDWFAGPGGAALSGFDGLLDVETHVDRTRGGGEVVTVLAFRDMTRLFEFLADRPASQALGALAEHAEELERKIFEAPPVYRAAAFSLLRPTGREIAAARQQTGGVP